MEEQKREAALRALKILRVTGKVRVVQGVNTAVVFVDGKYFGIYDFTRKTFVD